jgi:hypothetical protein
VYPDKRGFGGKCLPKDLAAIIRSAEQVSYVPGFLRAVMSANLRFRDASTTQPAPVPTSERSAANGDGLMVRGAPAAIMARGLESLGAAGED